MLLSRTVSSLSIMGLGDNEVRKDKKQRKNLLTEICPCIHSNACGMSGANQQIYSEDTWEAHKTSFIKGDMVHSAK